MDTLDDRSEFNVEGFYLLLVDAELAFVVKEEKLGDVIRLECARESLCNPFLLLLRLLSIGHIELVLHNYSILRICLIFFLHEGVNISWHVNMFKTLRSYVFLHLLARLLRDRLLATTWETELRQHPESVIN